MACTIAVSTLVGASREKVFEALTESAGLASFWTSDSQAEPVVGSVTRLRFPTGTRLELRVDALDPGHRVVWTPLTTIARPPRWTGTTVTWELKQAENGATEVVVEHGNWPDDLPQTALAQLTFLWAQVLRTLKAYVETAMPQPIFAGAEK